MPELVARDETGQELWRKDLPAAAVTLGRLEAQSNWATPDAKISALHARLTWDEKEGRLRVRHLPSGRNPIYYLGQSTRVGDEFLLPPGESFVIGETTFALQTGTLLQHEVGHTPDVPPLTEMTCSQEELRQVPFTDAGDRIGILAALPEIIRYSPSEDELGRRVVEVLRRGIPRAEAAAVVRLGQVDGGGRSTVTIEYGDDRWTQDPNRRPSARLVETAIVRERKSALYVWDAASLRRRPVDTPTQDPNFDWALCVPLPDEPAPGWGLYVAGRMSRELGQLSSVREDLLKGDLKFAELVAGVFGSLRQVIHLQKRQTELADFFPLAVRNALGNRNMEEVLQARQTDVTVLFCDLRGSVTIAEEGQDDLDALWQRVRPALDIMAGSIIERDGVIGDFQGDAAMGFWGWPIVFDDQAVRAARAALSIQKSFAKAASQGNSSLAQFRCGIGIAHGPAMAGRLGTFDQFKIDVFGPTVNLASRLESMTKRFNVSILIDERTAALLAGSKTSHCRCRRVARVQPAGMKKTVLTVSELLPPVGDRAAMNEGLRRDYEAALDLFIAGRWTDACRLFEPLAREDGGTRTSAGGASFHLEFIKDRKNTPPPDWKGYIELDSK